MNESELNLGNISRVVIVDEYGTYYDRRDLKVEADIQDGGQTLKLFVNDKTDENE